MIQQAIGLSDEVWVVVLERELALSQVCGGGGVDSNHKSSAPSDRYQFAYGLLSFRGIHHPTPLLSGGGEI